MSTATWQRGGWIGLPRQRIDMVGRTGEAFTAQLGGSIDALRLALGRHRWKETPKWTWRAALPYLNPSATLDELTPRPSLHEGLRAKYTAILPTEGKPNTRLVLRAFKTDRFVTVRDRTEPVYLLSLSREVLRRGLALYAVPSPFPETAEELRALLQLLDSSPGLYRLEPPPPEAGKPALYLASR